MSKIEGSPAFERPAIYVEGGLLPKTGYLSSSSRKVLHLIIEQIC